VDDLAGVAARDGLAASERRTSSRSRRPAAGVHLEAAAMARRDEERRGGEE